MQHSCQYLCQVVVCANWQYRKYDRQSTTPPPDPEANIAQDRQLENRSRKSLLEAGCPPCYPPEFEFPLQIVPAEYEVISYWQSLSGTGRTVLAAQWTDWEEFRDYQRKSRKHYSNTFSKFKEKIQDRQRRHGVEEDVALRPDLEEQSLVQNWIEFRDYHLQLHERCEQDVEDKVKKIRESLMLKDQTVSFLERKLKISKSKLKEHEKLLRWIEQERKKMGAIQGTSPTRHPRHRKTGRRRSPLGPVRAAVSKEAAPGQRRSSRLLAKNPHEQEAGHADTNASKRQLMARSKRQIALQPVEGVQRRSRRLRKKPERLGFG
jgi:hypothetical protein